MGGNLMTTRFKIQQVTVIAREKEKGIELQAYFNGSKRKPIYGKQAVISQEAWEQRPTGTAANDWALETCGIFDYAAN